MKFREICGVETKDKWPEPNMIRKNSDTNEQYFTPDFRKGVTYSKNRALFQKIAVLIEMDLEVSLELNNITFQFYITFFRTLAPKN